MSPANLLATIPALTRLEGELSKDDLLRNLCVILRDLAGLAKSLRAALGALTAQRNFVTFIDPHNWFVDAGYGSWVKGDFLPNVTPTPPFLSQHGLPDFSGFAYATVMFELQVDATNCTVCLSTGNWEEFVNGSWVPLQDNCLTGGVYHVRPEGAKIGAQINFSWSGIPEPSGFLLAVGLCVLATCRRSRRQ